MKNFMVYGSYGYTGQLIVEQAVKEGLKPLLAGRDEKLLRAQAEKFGLEYRAFSIENSAALDSALMEVDAVLHCAGPFVLTFRQMAEACIRTKRHYVDISGEIEGFEALALMDEEAKRAGIMLLPGGGFDVVPSDCLIAHTAGKLPSATHLELYIKSVSAVESHAARRVLELKICKEKGASAATERSSACQMCGAQKMWTSDVDLRGWSRWAGAMSARPITARAFPT